MTRRRGLTIGKVRGGLYDGARFLGDVQAVTAGHVVRRLRNRWLGRLFGLLMGRLS